MTPTQIEATYPPEVVAARKRVKPAGRWDVPSGIHPTPEADQLLHQRWVVRACQLLWPKPVQAMPRFYP